MRYPISRLTVPVFLSLSLLFALPPIVVQAKDRAKVAVCHIPPGNPANFHTITIRENAVQQHLNHGDLLGNCADNCATLCDDGDLCTEDACDPATEQCLAEHPPITCEGGESCDPTSGECVALCAPVGAQCDQSQPEACCTGLCSPFSGFGCALPSGAACDINNPGACFTGCCTRVSLDPPAFVCC